MKLRAVTLALLLLTCSQAGVPQAQATPSPTSSPAPTITPIAGDLPLTKVDFSCRLPATIASGGGDFATFTGGFITYPSAAFTPDPNGVIHSRYLEQDFETSATPALYGVPQDGPPFYDRGRHRWLPVSSAQSTPDGASYAYSYSQVRTRQIQAHVVDVATATEKIFDVNQPERAQVVDYGPPGVYLLLPSALGGPGEGVWLMNPASGAIKRLREVSQVMAVRDGYAWVGRVDPRNPPPTPSEGTVANSIVRVDLQTGAETNWYYRPGASIFVSGFDSRGRPVIVAAATHFDNGEVRLVEQPGSNGVLVYSGGLSLGGPQGDGDRLWFGGAGGIYLFTPARGLRKVFAFKPDPVLVEQVQPAGFCL